MAKYKCRQPVEHVYTKCSNNECGQEFYSANIRDTLCPRCRADLPECQSCHTVMASEHGYMEGFAKKVGKYDICTWCEAQLRSKGCLHISDSQWLWPSGKTTKRKIRPEDKV